MAESLDATLAAPGSGARKIEVDGDSDLLLRGRMLEAMGHELANVHLGVADRAAEIRSSVIARKGFGS